MTTAKYHVEDISRIAMFRDSAVLFMFDESAIIVTMPKMDIVAHITCDELSNGHRLSEWLTMVYFFIAVDVASPCHVGCPCGNLTDYPESLISLYFTE